MYPAPATPDWLSANDPELADEILGHNQHGARRCGWIAPRP
jgi:hypothetical protein